jgi:hypothetical protein
MTELADQIRSQAQQVGGDQAQHMNQFADALDHAASTGDLSGLRPQGHTHAHGHGHGHGHHHAAASSSSSSSASASDDGTTDAIGANDATSASGAMRKAAHAYQSNMPSPVEMLNQIVAQLGASSSSSGGGS